MVNFCHLQRCTISASFVNAQEQNTDHKMIPSSQ